MWTRLTDIEVVESRHSSLLWRLRSSHAYNLYTFNAGNVIDDFPQNSHDDIEFLSFFKSVRRRS